MAAGHAGIAGRQPDKYQSRPLAQHILLPDGLPIHPAFPGGLGYPAQHFTSCARTTQLGNISLLLHGGTLSGGSPGKEQGLASAFFPFLCFPIVLLGLPDAHFF